MRWMDRASCSSALRFGAVWSGRWGQNPRGKMMMELVMLYSARISGWPWLTVFCGDQRKLVSWSPIQWVGIPSPVVGNECLPWLFPGRAGTLGKHCSLSSPEKVCFLAGLTHPLCTDGTVHGPMTLVVVVQSLSRVQLFATPWTAAHQASCPLLSPRVYSDSCPLSQWYHPTISSSVIALSFCLQSFPTSGSFPMSHIRWPK